jgi:hypothetical protein
MAASQSAFAVGKMDRDEVRGGQLDCMSKSVKGERAIASNQRPASSDEGKDSGAISAQ